jgi:hypothetical protein
VWLPQETGNEVDWAAFAPKKERIIREDLMKFLEAIGRLPSELKGNGRE